MNEWLVLQVKRNLPKSSWFHLSELSMSVRAIPFRISALRRGPSGLHRVCLIFAACAPATGRRHCCSDRGVGEVSLRASRQRRGSGRLWGQTHGRTARRRVMEAVTMVTKVRCFGVPLRCDGWGEKQTWSKWCVSHQSPLPHTNPPPTSQKHPIVSRIW